ncbi:hypothetical protein GCM10010329_19130 [Streptomyces spiroverticillatus]|uniref:Uncharacterized protein n=1 Tax=Streptomyces finlayi TaxID=67296 RepID=A0A919C878_9ACTN|nr:hydrophobic protein [Streptomyces finlayi]GGZ97956.1 hypothetical protein GCM10010329_19130 [Streptomyces spiroverticillatus]GHC82936.1 hypothetical protein GCM10010334_11610 [Streptomyces finlayi]
MPLWIPLLLAVLISSGFGFTVRQLLRHFAAVLLVLWLAGYVTPARELLRPAPQ